jgi:hypothetical protein
LIKFIIYNTYQISIQNENSKSNRFIIIYNIILRGINSDFIKYYNIMFIFSGKSLNIIIISFFVYLFVNLAENLIHYNIGKFSDKETKLELPSKKDWVKIVVVMLFFALLQGLLTYYFI